MITQVDVNRLHNRAALDEFIATRYGSDSDSFVAALDKAVNGLLRSDFDAARTFIDSLKPIFKLLPSKYQARRIAMEGRRYHFTAQYPRALRTYARARALYRESRDYLNSARLGRILAEVYMYCGKYAEALEAGRSALRYFRRKKMMSDVGQTLTNIGNVYHRMDNNRAALRSYDRAREIFVEQGGPALGIVDYNRANIMTNLNRLSEARVLYDSAAKIYASAGMVIPETMARYSIAYLDFLEGKYTDALTLFEQVLDSFEHMGDTRAATITRLDLMELNIELNQFGTALFSGDAVCSTLARLGMSYEEAKAYYFMAMAKVSLGDHREATQLLRKAERLFTKEKNSLWLGMVYLARNRLYMAGGKYTQAVKASQGARRLFARSQDKRRTLDADIAELEAGLKTAQAGRLIKKSSALFRRRLTRYQRYSLNNALGDYYFSRKRFTLALRHYRAAIKTIETMISTLFSDEIRYFYVVDKYHSYNRMASCLLELGRTEEAFVGNLSALALLNQQAVSDSQLRAEIPPELLETVTALRQSLHRVSHFPREGSRGLGGESTISALEQRLWATERKIRAHVYNRARDSRERLVTDITAADIRRPDHVTVNWVAIGDRVGVFVAGDEFTRFVDSPISVSELRVQIRKLHFVAELAVYGAQARRSDSGADEDIILGDLYTALIAPVEELILGHKVTFVVDGLFGQIPFTALRGGDERYLAEVSEMSIVVNPADLIHRNGHPSDFSRGRNAIFAVSSDALPSVRVEGQRLRSLFGNAVLYDGDLAKVASLREELTRSDGFVHIATHASRSSENPLFSRMLMSDGPFFPFDLFGTGIKARLTTLSGCQTAAPGLNYGNSFSLAKAFYRAGSRFVLASLWPVADTLTMQFMAEFYAGLKDGKSVPDAYIRAVKAMRTLSKTPAFWGAFVLLGR